ncbi:binding-protein-dependent transport systems inner membrane component [Kribbella flavida DSM 17836]|uniref:Binding-protein-dependent transport systems inner membrane component n=1 Tax=Kribbella flavida (strain DSM 17836 / JCM 10339 / NBRC 14399) TaxID=479435 RepID=D2Q141_KRIFD|nr:carbohydrate ABC transporter permease [Kribbella flavida]ADB35742.1 binding-protein-dependent transport systems inner membrane component [Kribbella flavida DSM 17836]
MILDESRAGRIAKFTGLGICLVFTIFPLYWILVTSFKEPGSIFAYPLKYWPGDFSLENYRGLFEQSNFAVFLGNSLIVSLVAAALATVVSLLAAYVLARFEFVSKGAVMGAFLVTQMIPGFIALGSLYILMTRLYLVDSRFGLVLVYVAISIPLCTVMLRGFFENVPASLEEAAMVDGCSRFSALFRVLVPVMTPGIAASFIFNFVNCWNELFLSVTLLNSDSNKTVPAALNGFISSYNIDWGSMSAAAVLSIVPTMILFAFASRYIVQGLTAGAVKE